MTFGQRPGASPANYTFTFNNFQMLGHRWAAVSKDELNLIIIPAAHCSFIVIHLIDRWSVVRRGHDARGRRAPRALYVSLMFLL